MKPFVVVLFLVAVAGLAAGETRETLRLEASLDSMGTVYSIVLYGEDRNRMEEAMDEAFEEVRRIDRFLSNYRRDSELTNVNRLAAEQPVEVSTELAELLRACLGYSRQSEGTFDISVGPLMKVWGFYKGSGSLPKTAEVRKARELVGYQHITLDPKARTVRFARPGMELDPGGIGKGYAVDKVVAILRKRGIERALVSAGSSSLYALGAPPDEPGWRVRVRDPKDEEKAAAEVVLKDESLSTSGSYEKFFRAEGKVYSHIMDPRTGYPARGVLSVSVVAPRTLDSEAWTKPFFIQGRDWSVKHQPRGFRVFMCTGETEAETKPTCAWLQ